jgi:hypothetical protein
MKRFRGLLAVTIVMSSSVVAAQEVGTVAAVEGSVEIGRQGVWEPAAVGAAVHQGDELRTGRPGKLRVVFQDDTVLSVSEGSRVTVDEQVFQPADGKVHSVMNLLQGKVNALVGEYYGRPGAAYEIKTATAVAGVRGTEFSVSYDPYDEVTEVMGFSGRILVHSLWDPTGPGVIIGANETTTVAEGELPTQPRRYNERLFRQQLEGFDFIGGGRMESLIASHPLLAGANVPQPDRAPTVAGGAAVTLNEKRDASSLVGDSPAVVKALTGQLGIEF